MFTRRVSAVVRAAALAVSPVVAGAGARGAVSASERVSVTIAATAELSSRTALTVSTDVLRFDVTASGFPAVMSVEFSAGARTGAGGEVVLTVEPVRQVEGPGGSGGAGNSVAVAGDGQGTPAGLLRAGEPV